MVTVNSTSTAFYKLSCGPLVVLRPQVVKLDLPGSRCTVRTSRPVGAAAGGTVQIRWAASTGSSRTRPLANGDKTRPP